MKASTWFYGQGQRAKAYGLSIEEGLSILLGTRRSPAWIENQFGAGWFDAHNAPANIALQRQRAIQSIKQGA